MICYNCRRRNAAGLLSIALVASGLLAAPQTYAIVDASSENNTNAPSDGVPWANVGQVNGPSGIYVGAGWVLTAGHVGAGNINLSGTVYPWDGTLHWLTNSDGTFADAILFHLQAIPPLPRIPLVSSTPLALSQVDMIGFGYRAGSAQTTFSLGTTGFPWSTTSGVKTWGNNKIDSGGTSTVNDGFTNVVAFSTTFDAPPLQTSDECQAAVGDSGSGVFYNSSSGWELAGMVVAINETLTNRPFNSAVYTDQTFAVDIATYRNQVVFWIEATIPSLSIVASGTNVQVSWIDTGANYTLLATASLSPENWAPLSPALSSTNGQIIATVPMSADNRFFRLQKQ